MVLVKCKCGCFYTLKEAGLRDLDKKCPNCGVEHLLSQYQSISGVNVRLPNDELEIRIVPDDVKIQISFEA